MAAVLLAVVVMQSHDHLGQPSGQAAVIFRSGALSSAVVVS